MRQQFCEDEGGEWMALREGWAKECYRGYFWQDCMMKGEDYTTWWDDEKDEEVCGTQEDMCSFYGQTWTTDEWGYSYCQWNLNLKSVVHKLERHAKARHILTSYVLDFDLRELEEITQPVALGEEEGQELVMAMEREIEEVVEDWMPELEAWYQAQQKREEEAFFELANVVVDSVTADG